MGITQRFAGKEFAADVTLELFRKPRYLYIVVKGGGLLLPLRGK